MSAKRPSLKGKGAQIFLGGNDDEKAEEHSSEKHVSEVADRVKPVKPATQKAVKPEATPQPQKEAVVVEAGKIEKEKATFYLPVDVLLDLESLWHAARRHTHKKITKSEIVSWALQHASDEVQAWQNGERKRSKLMDRLSK